MFGLLKKSKPQQDVYFPFKTVLEKDPMIFENKKQFASNGFDFVQKQRNQRKRQNRFDDDEKWVRSGDCPFTKAKRSNRDVFYQNELQTYVSLEKMLHKSIHAIRQLKKKGNTNTSPAPKQQSNFSPLSNSDLKTNVSSSDKSKAVKPTRKALSTRLTEPCTGSTCVRPEWSFGWNHDQTTELTVPELVFPDHLDILRTIVEPDLAWVVKNLKTDMDSHLADHPDSPAGVLIVTAVHLSGSDESGQ
uniref:Uncharacterized protein n=1 Tax=Brassica oleracea var. oleracea TaxID=109376 RepID=A0A0D3CG83_BRAOL